MNVTSIQCYYCQNASAMGCAECYSRAENGYLPSKLRTASIKSYKKDVAYGSIYTKKAWEMLPTGYKLLFLVIVGEGGLICGV